jgi:RNA polymerase sigma-70 factor (ECF subfamily)
VADFGNSTDAELVGLTREGNGEAYKELVTRYQGHVYGLAYSLLGNWAEAQDVAQETFVRTFINIDRLREPAKFAAWLRRVAFGVAMDWLRTFRPRLFEKIEGQVDLDRLEIPDFQPGPPELAHQRELADIVMAAVASLPPKYRVPLTMFHLDGLSYKKVADFLDIPLGTAKSLISRAQGKLRAVLTVTAKEMIPVIQEVFNEHRLPQEFAERVLEGVPGLAWGKGKDCTFAGALEAAMAVTEHPYSYSDLMGFTGLAFRVRWFKGPDGQGICPSCAVGEMKEEIAAAQRATGWKLRVEVHQGENMEQYAPQIVASINEGKPVAAYTDYLDMSVVYGYGESGRTLFFRDYNRGQKLQLPAAKLGWMWLVLGEYRPVLSRQQAVIEALKIAVHNWRREVGTEGPGDYWYGPAAYRAWSDRLAHHDAMAEDRRKLLSHVNQFNFIALVDARRAAVAFLQENAPVLNEQARPALVRAAEVYEQAVTFLKSKRAAKTACFAAPTDKARQNWSDDVRRQEMEILAEAERRDADAIAELDRALSLAS